MSKIFVQFSDETSSRVVSVFSCAQDPQVHSHQGVIDDDDPRYLAFVEPARVPFSVSRYQARAALYQAGHLDDVEAFMARADTPMLVKLAWQDAQTFERPSATVALLAEKLELSDDDVDALFVAGAAITA